jgi:1,2-diacylglycerol 3-beta-galactosyltransferase
MNCPRILLLCSDAGFGHRSAAQAIAAAIEDNYAGQCQVEIVNPLNARRAPGILRRTESEYDDLVRNWPELYRLGYQANEMLVTSTLLESLLTVLLYEAMRLLLNQYDPHVIITTYPFYQPPLWAYFSLKNRQIPTITVITDLADVHRLWFHRLADYCVAPTPAVAELAVSYGIEPSKIKVWGIPIHPQFAHKPADRHALRQQLGWQPDRMTVLAVGSKRVSKLPGFLRPLNHSGLPIQLAVVAGGDEEMFQELRTTKWHLPTHVYNFVDNMAELMHAADGVICKAGGLTVTESLACGLPMLLIDAIPGQETGNAEYAMRVGAADLVRKPILLLETVFHWLMDDAALWQQRAANARRVGQPHAAYHVADLAYELASQGPYRRRNFRVSRAAPG